MKKTILVFAAIWFISISVMGQKSKKKSSQMKSVKQSKEVVQGFFSAFGKGDFDGIINSFHDSCIIVG